MARCCAAFCGDPPPPARDTSDLSPALDATPQSLALLAPGGSSPLTRHVMNQVAVVKSGWISKEGAVVRSWNQVCC